VIAAITSDQLLALMLALNGVTITACLWLCVLVVRNREHLAVLEERTRKLINGKEDHGEEHGVQRRS